MRFRCCINEKPPEGGFSMTRQSSLELRTGVTDGVGNIELLKFSMNLPASSFAAWS